MQAAATLHTERRSMPAQRTALGLLVGALIGVAVMRLDVRLLIAVTATFLLAITTVRHRQVAITATLTMLPFLGLLRRLLIPVDGWPAQDPLLLVGPAVAFMLFFLAIWERRIRWRTSALAATVVYFTLWMTIEGLNPTGGLLANLAGLLFVVVPLLWFFIGLAFGGELLLERLLLVIVVLSGVIGIYGLFQTFIGFPAWDASWVRYVGSSYVALNANGTVRAFGTFPSSAEYATFLAMGLVISVALLLGKRTRRWWPLLGPVMAVTGAGIVMDATRTIVVLAVLGCGLVWALGARSSRRFIGRTALILGIGAAAYIRLVSGVQLPTLGGPESLLAHQVNGLGQPFNPQDSTLALHLQIVLNGLARSLQRPWGYGLGSVNLGAAKFGSPSDIGIGTEYDLSNAFVAGGIIGGMLYLVVVVRTWTLALTQGLRGQWSFVALAGVLMVTFGAWLNGGLYFVAPFVWFAVGSAVHIAQTATDWQSTAGADER